jgi:hypothetical protein
MAFPDMGLAAGSTSKLSGHAVDQRAQVLDTAGAVVARDRIIMFAALFDVAPTSKVSDLVERIASLPGPGHTGSPNLRDVGVLLSALKVLLNKTSKTAVLTDISSIETILRDRASIEIGAFVRMVTEAAAAPRRPTGRRGASTIRDDLVVQYKEKLEASLGDEEKFRAVYNDLRANIAIGKPEIVALAKQMTGSGARTVDAALKKVWNRHQSLMVFKAKSRATGGRSAA